MTPQEPIDRAVAALEYRERSLRAIIAAKAQSVADHALRLVGVVTDTEYTVSAVVNGLGEFQSETTILDAYCGQLEAVREALRTVRGIASEEATPETWFVIDPDSAATWGPYSWEGARTARKELEVAGTPGNLQVRLVR